MAAPTSLAEAFNKTLANGEPSTHSTRRTLLSLLVLPKNQTFNAQIHVA